MADPIRIWRFREAPPELQALSLHGGGEEWLALVPPPMAKFVSLVERPVAWDLWRLHARLSSDHTRGERVDIYPLEDGSEVWICGH